MMANRLFTRNRIRGVSFHHGRSAVIASGSRKSRTKASVLPSQSPASAPDAAFSAWFGPSLTQIRESAPLSFKKSDLKRLLADYGRNELHTLVSEAVEQLGRLRQLSQSILRFSGTGEPDRRFLNPDLDDDESPDPMRDAGIEIMRVQRLWKLRLELLEMVAMAQDSLRSLNLKSAKKPPQPVPASSPRQK